ncbi:MAG: type II toxin-antitoxin system HipA family toxin YjjJ [Sulfuritalea sp.]|nr:type II toxin-antitoxin system HipA family toxin YjjJ [Sulfuritalea sp.]
MTKLRDDDLLRALRTHPRAGSAALCRLLGGINRSTLARALRVLAGQVVSRGGSRRTRYSLRRSLRGSEAGLPLYRVDESGQGHEVGRLDLTWPSGSALGFAAPFPWPLDGDMADGWFEGLPYPVGDMRPQGFIGRNFARRHALDLGVADNPEQWSEDDILHVLSLWGHDQPGDLILGETAYRRFLDGRRERAGDFLADSQIGTAFPELADAALAHGVPASSAGGEFPKFTVGRHWDDGVGHAIVKFSGADDSPAVRRWSDLLVCEHLALEALRDLLGLAVAQSAIHCFGGRSFLEVRRFDRHGAFGRSPVCTLGSINAALLGQRVTTWPMAAQALQASGWLAAEDVERVTLLWWFGRLIGNADMHEGNLAFRPRAGSGLVLAPAYDMLPMHYAPLRGGEVPQRTFAPEWPLPAEAGRWHRAADAAARYWHRCAEDERIGAEFRRICADNAAALAQALEATAAAASRRGGVSFPP